MNWSTALGKAGEERAAQEYLQRGYTIVGRNVRTRSGEVDIIALAPDGTMVFIEVKTRSSQRFGGAEAVTAAKLIRLRKAAAEYLSAQHCPYQVRFDVVELIGAPGAGEGGIAAQGEMLVYQGVE